jgi:hypothetical protein
VWIDGNPAPAVGPLHLPDSSLGQLVHRAYGASWAGRAQMWMFDLAWGLRNANEHGVDPETQRMIRLAKAERAKYRSLIGIHPNVSSTRPVLFA